MKANINNAKLNAYKKVLQEVCEKFNLAEQYIKERFGELYGRKLSVEEQLQQLLKVELPVFC